MRDYTNVESNILALFGSTTWTANNIKTFPANFVTENVSGEYIKVTLVYDRSTSNISDGQMIVDIFIPANSGNKTITNIADALDNMLCDKTVKVSTDAVQFFKSYLRPVGFDKENPQLYRAIYAIDFKYFRSNK